MARSSNAFLRNKRLFSKHTTSTQEQAKSNAIPASEQKVHWGDEGHRCHSARGKCKFLAFPARQFQGRAATAWRKDCRVKERRVKKNSKTDDEGWKEQGSDILPGMWKPEVNAHSYKQQASRNGKEFAQERWEIKSASEQNSALHNHRVLSVIACFLARHAKADVHCLNLTRSLGDTLLRVISACNNVCLSVLQVSDSLGEWMIRKAVRKAVTSGRAWASSPRHWGWPATHTVPAHLQAGCCMPHTAFEANRAPGTGRISSLKVTWTADSSVGLCYSSKASQNTCTWV